MRPILLFALAIVLAGAHSARGAIFPPPSAFPTGPAPHVRTRLLSDYASVPAGTPFHLGVLFEIDSPWHIYWKNPGDAGRPTQVAFQLPEGFQQSNLIFPMPERIEQPGPIISFVYTGQVMLWTIVTPPKDWERNKPIAVTASAKWLVCDQDCIPGVAGLQGLLRVADRNKADIAIINQWLPRAPVPLTADIGTARCQSSMETVGNHTTILCHLHIDWTHPRMGGLQIFPELLPTYSIEARFSGDRDRELHAAGSASDDIDFVINTLAGQKPARVQMPINLAWKVDDDPRGTVVCISLPDCKIIEPPAQKPATTQPGGNNAALQ